MATATGTWYELDAWPSSGQTVNVIGTIEMDLIDQYSGLEDRGVAPGNQYYHYSREFLAPTADEANITRADTFNANFNSDYEIVKAGYAYAENDFLATFADGTTLSDPGSRSGYQGDIEAGNQFGSSFQVVQTADGRVFVYSQDNESTGAQDDILMASLDHGALTSFKLSGFTQQRDGGGYGGTVNNTGWAGGIAGFGDTAVPCLVRGSRILVSPTESKAVEELKVGDEVLTFHNGIQKIRWIGSAKRCNLSSAQNSKLRPIRITAGALGAGLPESDLLVSPQHRMLVSSQVAKRITGAHDVLIAAVHLTELPGIFVEERIEEVEYFHVLFDAHEVIIANGAPTESLFAGPMALKALSPEARAEIAAVFPDLDINEFSKSTVIPEGRLQKKIVARHLKNQKAMLA